MRVVEKLRELILANPDLDIVPFVGEEMCYGDYPYVMGSVTKCSIESFAISPYDFGRVLLEQTDFEDFADRYCFEHGRDESIHEEDIESAFRGLAWHKAIMIWVDSL